MSGGGVRQPESGGGAAARHARVKDIFLEVRERPEAERAAALAELCAGDAALAREVESLLRFDRDEDVVGAPPSLESEAGPGAMPAGSGSQAGLSEVGDPLGLLGHTLDGRYRVESLASEGGFAYVYRAEQILWRRPVAVKVFKFDRGDESLRDAFVKEGALLNELSRRTTAIVQSYDVGTWVDAGGRHRVFTVLEWLDGKTLAQRLSAERATGPAPWSLSQVLAEMGPVADALAVAHAAGVAHRDVKPANIFLVEMDGTGGRARKRATKLLDFGVAKVAAEQAGGFLATGGRMAAFTLAWAAPEQLSKRHGATGPWTDVYALALVCSDLLAGRRRPDADDPVRATLRFTDPSARPTPARLGVEVTPAVEAVFERALGIEPATRYPDVATFWSALVAAVATPVAPRPYLRGTPALAIASGIALAIAVAAWLVWH